MKAVASKNSEFSPVFVVGSPRSGTTMLAVILNRHSSFAIPPETQFFADFQSDESAISLPSASREDKILLALGYHRISDLGLSFDDVMKRFALYENTVANLFRSILEAYGDRMHKSRVGEKSPKHIEHVPLLLELYPAAKIICIVRDGRDVVRSLVKAPWAEPGNPRRFGLFCAEWSGYARLAEKYGKMLPRNRFLIVQYEEILQHPRQEVANVCNFLEVAFESGMLSATRPSGVVPEWEVQWKQKADQLLDPSRVQAWRKQVTIEELWKMNVRMGAELDIFGYDNTSVSACPLWLRIVYRIQKIPYLPIMRKISLFGLRLIRAVTDIFK